MADDVLNTLHVSVQRPQTEGWRMFVVGDIHGCLQELEEQLRTLDFDRTKDCLYAVGDLVDRGPKSAEVMRLLDEPWFFSIRGNHEEMMILSAAGNSDAQDMHVINGGVWFAMLDQTERDELAAMALELPIAMTVTSPSGRRIGLVHADLPGSDWKEFTNRLNEQAVQDYAMWARERVGTAKRGGNLVPIQNVDHVYFGHTPLREPARSANMSWIDTGCFATGRMHVEEVL